MNEAGVSRASRSTREAAGCRRDMSAAKSNPEGVLTTISPSTTSAGSPSARKASTTSGK